MTNEIPSVLIAKFDKNAHEQVRITLDDFKGRKLINIRVWFQHLEYGTWMPGKQGIALPIDKFDALETAIKQVREKLKEQQSGG